MKARYHFSWENFTYHNDAILFIPVRNEGGDMIKPCRTPELVIDGELKTPLTPPPPLLQVIFTTGSNLLEYQHHLAFENRGPMDKVWGPRASNFTCGPTKFGQEQMHLMGSLKVQRPIRLLFLK